MDPFCGAGRNIIKLAMICKRAVDIEPNKIKMARHNSEIWGVADKIYSKLKVDVVFISPPWRGPGYSFIKCYSVEIMSNK
ncbi:trimethylguanosine synthase-like [Aphis craccivora]|uniref:Trimethylguanosine synthase n=1 Tax=Aphis craccivora TaxID=307492 RepID=A0A6G0VZA7_APHCR|nr:trimethylguanosine synthase-like [Aphis craccivora]